MWIRLKCAEGQRLQANTTKPERTKRRLWSRHAADGQEEEALQEATSNWLAAHQQACLPEEGSPCTGRHVRSWSLVSRDGSVIYRGNSLGDNDKPDQVCHVSAQGSV